MLPRFLAQTELATLDPLTNVPALVVPQEYVRAAAPNRGHLALGGNTDWLAMMQRVHQTLSWGDAPAALWQHSTATLTLSADLPLTYTVDDPTTATAVRRTVLKAGTWNFAGASILAVPLGLDVPLTEVQPNGAVTPSTYGQAQWFADDAAAQAFFRTLSTATPFGRESALRYVVVARRVGTTLQLVGQTLRSGAQLEAGLRDAEYSGDAQVTLLGRRINQDRNLILMGGGDITVSPASGGVTVVCTLNTLRVLVPGGYVTSYPSGTSPYTLTAASNGLFGTFSRTASTTGVLSVGPASLASRDLEGQLLLAVWDPADNVLRWMDGTAYRPLDSFPLGLPFSPAPAVLAEELATVSVFPSDAAADAGMPVGADWVGFVVEGTDRNEIRLTTREALTLQDTPAHEVLRAGAVRVSQLRLPATSSTIRVRDTAGTADAPFGCSILYSTELRHSVTVGDTLLTDPLHTTTVTADTQVTTPLVAGGGGITEIGASGAGVRVDTANSIVTLPGELRSRDGVGLFTLKDASGTSPGGVAAATANLSSYLHLSHVSTPDVRAPAAVRFRDAGGTSPQEIDVEAVRVSGSVYPRVEFVDTASRLVGVAEAAGIYEAGVGVYAGASLGSLSCQELRLAGVTSRIHVAASTCAVVATVDGMTLRSMRMEDLHLGGTVGAAHVRLGSNTDTLVITNAGETAPRDVRLRQLQVMGSSAAPFADPPDAIIRSVNGHTTVRNGPDTARANFLARNTVVAAGQVRHDGSNWVFTGVGVATVTYIEANGTWTLTFHVNFVPAGATLLPAVTFNTVHATPAAYWLRCTNLTVGQVVIQVGDGTGPLSLTDTPGQAQDFAFFVQVVALEP